MVSHKLYVYHKSGREIENKENIIFNITNLAQSPTQNNVKSCDWGLNFIFELSLFSVLTLKKPTTEKRCFTGYLQTLTQI